MEPEVAHIHGFLVAIEVIGIITTVLCKSYVHVVLRNSRFVLAKCCRKFADILHRLKTIFRRNGRDSSPCQTKSRHFAEQNKTIDESSATAKIRLSEISLLRGKPWRNFPHTRCKETRQGLEHPDEMFLQCIATAAFRFS